MCEREWLVRGVADFESPVELNISIAVFRQALARALSFPLDRFLYSLRALEHFVLAIRRRPVVSVYSCCL